LQTNINNIDMCIARLYRLAAMGSEGYRRKALTELTQIIDFDGALWGTGRLDSKSFHSVDVLGVDESYPQALAQYKNINPFYTALQKTPGTAVDMVDVLSDAAFYQSPVYHDFFSQYSVERIMGVLLPDAATGIITLVSLYRFDRDKPFDQNDRDKLTRMVFHLVNGASHACFLHLEQQSDPNKNIALAICDQHGLFFEAQPYFMQLLKNNFPQNSVGRLPFQLNNETAKSLPPGLQINTKTLGDLVCISLWETSPLDLLSAKEMAVVESVTRGLSFKQAARELGVAPSTVSNHLYKVYRKLNISSRSELANIAAPSNNLN